MAQPGQTRHAAPLYDRPQIAFGSRVFTAPFVAGPRAVTPAAINATSTVTATAGKRIASPTGLAHTVHPAPVVLPDYPNASRMVGPIITVGALPIVLVALSATSDIVASIRDFSPISGVAIFASSEFDSAEIHLPRLAQAAITATSDVTASLPKTLIIPRYANTFTLTPDPASEFTLTPIS